MFWKSIFGASIWVISLCLKWAFEATVWRKLVHVSEGILGLLFEWSVHVSESIFGAVVWVINPCFKRAFEAAVWRKLVHISKRILRLLFEWSVRVLKEHFWAAVWVTNPCFEGVRLWFSERGSVRFSEEKSGLLFSKRISPCLGVIRGCCFKRGLVRVSEERGGPYQKSFGKHYCIREQYQPMFSEPDWSLNRKSYRFTVHRSDRRSNRYQTGDVININFIILYIIKNLKINKFYVNFDSIYFVCWVLSQIFLPIKVINYHIWYL